MGGKFVRFNTDHDNQFKEAALLLLQSVENVIHVVATARKSIECGNCGVGKKLVQGPSRLRAPISGLARDIQHSADIAPFARVFERGGVTMDQFL